MKKRRIKRKIRKIPLLILKFLLLIGFVLGLYFIIFNSSKKEVPKVKHKSEIKKEKKEYKASLIMVGDALIHSGVYLDAKQDDGSYNFKPMLELTKPIINKYDLKYYNQETILGGVELGLSSYPRFNSPTEVGDAFLDSGFNLVSLATNHTMDKGEIGVLKSLEYWDSKKR